jgi:hypothetical protein
VGWWVIGKEDDAILKPVLKIFEKGTLVLVLCCRWFWKWSI